MPHRDLFRTTAFRWAMVFAAAFTGLSFVLFAFVYWQTAGYERTQLDTILRREAKVIADDPNAETALKTWLRDDVHNVRYGILVGRDGVSQAGNMPMVPEDLRLDAKPQYVATEAQDADGDERAERIRALGLLLSDGRTLALGSDTDEVEHVQVVILRALGLGLGPMVALSLLGGAILGRRALGRVTIFSQAISQIREGRLSGRLPTTGRRDEFDTLAVDINAMMDEIERLLDEVRSVGDSIAHDLRTPLTRARTRLERSRNSVTTAAEFAAAIDEAVGWLDQTFAVITAVLRIGEIEHGRRRAAFKPVDLGQILLEVAELYDPIAEEKETTIRVVVEQAEGVSAMGDRDLLFEAVANLLDNAIKFTPRHGHVLLSLAERSGRAVVTVADDGPGIAEADRKRVLQRFYRAERSRQREGVGLGLSLVSAITTLHGFHLMIGDNHPGCRIELTCRALTDPSPTAGEDYFDFAPTDDVDAARAGPASEPSSPPQPKTWSFNRRGSVKGFTKTSGTAPMSEGAVAMTEAVYDRITIVQHWVTAASVTVLWVIGQTVDWLPHGPTNVAVWSVHVVLGFVLAAILIWRIAWRTSGGRHLPPADTGALQAFAKLTHYLLYAFLLVVVALGVLNAFVRGYDLFDLVSLPQLGNLAWRRPITRWHGLSANILLGLAAFHAVAALVHHYFWHDAVLKRMLPGAPVDEARPGDARRRATRP